VRLIRALWTEESVSFEGDYYTTVDASIYDRPTTPVPIYVAAGGPQMARYAGRAGDGMICTSGKGMELYTDKLMPALAEGREKAGTPGTDGVDRTIEIKISYDRDADRALENTRFWAPLSLTAEQKQSVTTAQEMEKLADELPIEQIAQRWIVTSDPDEAVEQVRPYVEAGLDHLVLHGPGSDQRRFLEQVGEDLVPRLRGLGA
jgi:coenzyme F420-dependent glucose-6-phosphate dehydrogenase